MNTYPMTLKDRRSILEKARNTYTWEFYNRCINLSDPFITRYYHFLRIHSVLNFLEDIF